MFRTSGISALIVILLTAAAVEGQQSRGPRRRGPFRARAVGEGLVFLAAISEVREELGVTREQEALLDALQADLRHQRRGIIRGRFDRPRRRRDRRGSQEVRERLQTLNEGGEKLVMIILEPKQSERLKELRLQFEGVRALDRPEFVRALGVSKLQMERIREIRRADRRASGEDESLSYQDELESEKELETKVADVLTDEQNEQWKKMRGEAFDFPEWSTRFERRGFRGRRGDGR